MATRLYLIKNTAPDLTPSSWSAGWNSTASAVDATLHPLKSGSTGSSTLGGTGVSGQFRAVSRFVSLPLLAQTISGNVKGQIRCLETNSTDNYNLAFAVKVIKADGTDRGISLAVSASDDVSAQPPEMASGGTVTNRKLRDSSENTSIALSSVSVSTGDRLVVEYGFRQDSTSTANATLVDWSTATNADIAEDDTTTAVTSAWIEFDTDILFVPYYFGSAATPEDAASEISEPVTSAVTPPTGMLAGDLVLLWGQLQVAAANASITQSELGGQTWEEVSLTAQGNDQSVNLYFCTFDGTWDANPSIAFAAQSGTQPATCGMHVFRPPATNYTWAIDSAGAFSAFAAPTTPFTVTISGQTLNNDNTVTLAGWFTGDDNSWTSIAGTGWSVTGTAQYRNTSGSDQSASFAHYINATAGSPGPSTGNVSKNQTTVTGDAGITIIATFYASAPDPNAEATPSGVTGTGSAGTLTVAGDANLSVSGVSATGAAGDVTVTIVTDVPVTGVAATGSAGTATVTGDANVSVTGVSSTGFAGEVTASGQTNATANPSGVSATGSAGDVAVSGAASVAVTGVSATGSGGTATVAGDATVSVTGVSATGQAGEVTASAQENAEATPSGVSATGQAGDVTVSGGASVAVTGVSATGSVGNTSLVGDANVSPTGVAATGAAGDVSVGIDMSVAPTGVSATGSAGDVSITGGANVSVTGNSASGSAGEVTITAGARVSVTGVSATGFAGDVTVDTAVNATATPSGVSATGQAGDVTVTGDALVLVTGVSATGFAGTATASVEGDVSVTPTGVAATGFAGDPSIAGDANVSITGVGATAQTGTVTIQVGVQAQPSGVSATGQAGSVTVTGSAVVAPTGVSATGQVGEAVASSNDVTVAVTGVSATGQVGNVTVTGDQPVTTTSISSGGQVRRRRKRPSFTVIEPERPDRTIRRDVTVRVTGVYAIASVGQVIAGESLKSAQRRRKFMVLLH